MSKLLSEDLEKLNILFEQSEEVTDSYENLPDGEYPVEVLSVEIKKTKTTDKLMVAWRFKVIEGEEGAGRNIFNNLVIEDKPKNLKRFRNDVAKFGFETDSLAELLASVDQLVGEFCLVQLKTDDKNNQWITIDVDNSEF